MSNRYFMATNIMKWMKNKLNGYKPIPVLPGSEMGDSRLSDTEVLIKPSTFLSEESVPSDRQEESPRFTNRRPFISQQESTNVPSDTRKPHISFEELECDVSVDCEGGTKGQRREFSFTLYDLDGHGKITKDDIAGLVKTIYETLGQTIKVPHYGSKTIKVRLTVSPEKKNSSLKDDTNVNPSSGAKPLTKESICNQWRKEVSCGRFRERRQRQQEHKVRRRHSFSSSGGVTSDDIEADISDDADEDSHSFDGNRRIQNIINVGIASSPATIYSRYKKRASSLQRQELLQIIQANMEKNNLCFQTSRKPCNNEMHPHSRQGRKLDNNFPKTYDEPFPRPFINRLSESTNCMRERNANRCGFQPPILHHHHVQSSSLYANPKSCQTHNEPVHLSSHEMKHRYRVLEQARAKEQVIHWLEKEFSAPSRKYVYGENKTNVRDECKTKQISSHSNNNHYVHEHIHHHYHHYQDTPPVEYAIL